jgi:S-adenosylmethionine:tRNA ribosyltransferase-isomerase
MIAASEPVQRRPDAKLLLIRSGGSIEHWPRSAWVSLLRPGDLVVANDAATLPASLFGTHLATGRAIEVRLAGRGSLDPGQVSCFFAVLFGAGDFRIRTEDRPSPPPVAPGDHLQLGPLRATVERLQDHPRLVLLRFDGSAQEIWAGFARHGPSAGFAMSWDTLGSMAQKDVQFATLTHSAGLSSTGDAELDARLPFDEPYRIPVSTAAAVARAKERGGRIVAVGTTVVRALEHAAAGGLVASGLGVATQRIGPATRLRAVDALLSGTHEKGTSHYDLLRAFVSEITLARMEQQLDAHGYRTHEFGDSILVQKAAAVSDAL